MAAISMNDSLQRLAEKVLLMDSLTSNESDSQTLRDDIAAHSLTLRSIRILKNALVLMDDKNSLHSYITGSKLTFPNFKTPAREASKELVKRREYLLLRKEAKAYNKMIYGTEENPNTQDILTTGNQFASMTNQLTISVNMIVAVFAMFGVGYYVGMQYSDNKTTQMTFGLVCAIGIMIVEMIIFIRRATQMESTYEKNPSQQEMATAQMRSGALLTASKPYNTGSPDVGEETLNLSKTSNIEISTISVGESKKTK